MFSGVKVNKARGDHELEDREAVLPGARVATPGESQGFTRPIFDLPPNPSIDHLVPVILLECEGRSGEDGAQATTEFIV
jgi:hypothetical protein